MRTTAKPQKPTGERYDRPRTVGRLELRLKPDARSHLLLLSGEGFHAQELVLERLIFNRWRNRSYNPPLPVKPYRWGERVKLPRVQYALKRIFIEHLNELGDGEPAARERVLEALLANAHEHMLRRERKKNRVGSPP